jgi:HSP20 family protein
MFGFTPSNPIEEMLNVHSHFDRLFNQFWNELPARTSAAGNPGVQVRTTEDAWRVSVPMPGIDPKYVSLDASANRLTIRAEQPEEGDASYARIEQTIAVPNVVDLDKVKASYRYGVLELTLPWKESVKPRRIQIETSGAEPKQLHAVAS